MKGVSKKALRKAEKEMDERSWKSFKKFVLNPKHDCLFRLESEGGQIFDIDIMRFRALMLGKDPDALGDEWDWCSPVVKTGIIEFLPRLKVAKK